jgi:hypothetical protein
MSKFNWIKTEGDALKGAATPDVNVSGIKVGELDDDCNRISSYSAKVADTETLVGVETSGDDYSDSECTEPKGKLIYCIKLIILYLIYSVKKERYIRMTKLLPVPKV